MNWRPRVLLYGGAGRERVDLAIREIVVARARGGWVTRKERGEEAPTKDAPTARKASGRRQSAARCVKAEKWPARWVNNAGEQGVQTFRVLLAERLISEVRQVSHSQELLIPERDGCVRLPTTPLHSVRPLLSDASLHFTAHILTSAPASHCFPPLILKACTPTVQACLLLLALARCISAASYMFKT